MIRALHPFRRAAALLAFAMTLLLALPAGAQMFSSSAGAPMPASDAFQLSVTSRADGARVLSWSVADGYYLYRDHLAAEAEDGTPVGLETPPGTDMDDPTFGAVEVYFGAAEAVLAPVDGPVTVTWQGCQDGGICYPPIQKTLAASPSAAPPPPDTGVVLARDTGALEALRSRGGAVLVLAGFFGFGLLLAFTPCVFPMFPILAGILTGQGGDLTMRRGAALSGVYVLAMASAFGLLGVAAAWSGQNLQMVMQSPAAIYGVAAIFALLSLSMFGLYELQLPASWTRRLSRAGSGQGSSLGGAATLGFTSALIVGPCVTAPLAGALLYIAGTGDVALGAGALFALGLGQGVPLLIAGTLGAQVLPRAGGWMDGVKRLFGFVFLGMAIWLIGRLVGGPVILALWAALLIGAGVFAGALDLLPQGAGPAQRGGKTAGILSMLAGVLMAVGAALGGDDPLRPLAGLRGGSGAGAAGDAVQFTTVTAPGQLDAALAAQTDTPALIYVTADWCVSCRAIERTVWPDPGVRAALAGMNVIAVDVSDPGEASQAVLGRLGAAGPPTMVFLDRTKTEKEGTRIIGSTRPGAVRSAAVAVQ